MLLTILLAIWEFLVALGPLLSAIGTFLVSIATALWEITKITAVVTLMIATIEILFDPRGKQRVANLLYNITKGGLDIITTVLKQAEPELQATVQALADGIKAVGPGIRDTVSGPVGDVAATSLAKAQVNLEAGGLSTPDNAIDQAIAAFRQAYSAGFASHIVTAAFEACLPEKLNTLNGVGPALAQMAGFEEVSKRALDPLYDNAFGKSLEYKYRSLFKPEYPDEGDAVTWHSRRLLSDDQLKVIFGVSGLKTEYENAYVQSAYRPVPPFILSRAAEAGAFGLPQLRQILEFDGFRDQDIDALIIAWSVVAKQPYQNAYLSALKRSVELGIDQPADLARAMDDIGLDPDIQIWVQLEVSTRKLEQLAELYRKSVSEAYSYGIVTDDQYIPSMEAIGVDAADAQAHYAIDSYKKQGKALIAAASAERALERKRQSAAQAAAIANYRDGQIDEAGLSAALLLAGLDPQIAAFAVEVQAARRRGPLVFVYGLELSRGAALQLREKVSAIENQVKKQLITPDQGLAFLLDLEIPASNADALIATWAALRTKPTTTGIKLGF